ncbi:MAG TPA: peroxidase family protein [Steroidobacteraceae bacterium]|nr:peroxidase family protein [Steroidobacteraceae bacterium]
MSAPDRTPPGVGGFFSLFNLPPTVFRADLLERLGEAMTQGTIHGATEIESGYVYLGQMVAHDVSKLTPPPNRSFFPAADIEQLRTAALDLDSVYGAGVNAPPVDVATGKLQLGRVLDEHGQFAAEDDLPRTLGGQALIGEERDDENLLVAQLHVQFIKLHNYFVERCKAEKPAATPRDCFEQARTQLTLHYQQVVLYDYLERILDPDVWQYVVLNKRDSLWQPSACEALRMPIEFAAAAFRFGHSMVLPTYTLNRSERADLKRLFALTGNGGLAGNAALPASVAVNWEHFFATRDPVTLINKALPIRPVTPIRMPDGTSLAVRNLMTGNKSMLPDAQAVVQHIWRAHHKLATALHLRTLNAAELNPTAFFVVDPNQPPRVEKLLDRVGDDHGFDRKTPLWYYILAEAWHQHQGARLGTLGSLIVGSVLRALVTLSRPTIGEAAFRSQFIQPTKKVPVSAATPDGFVLSMDDLLGAVRSRDARYATTDQPARLLRVV